MNCMFIDNSKMELSNGRNGTQVSRVVGVHPDHCATNAYLRLFDGI